MTAVTRRDEVGKRKVRATGFLHHLLAQRMKTHRHIGVRAIGEHDDVVTVARGGQQAVGAVCAEPFFLHDAA